MEQVSIVTGITGSQNPEAEGQQVPAEVQSQETAPQAERPAWLPEGFDSPEDLAKAYAELQESKQKGSDEPLSPEEVAAAVAWLCAPESASVTGQCISVAGGEVA